MFATALTCVLNRTGSLSAYVQEALPSPLAQKIKNIVVPYFKGGASLFLCGFGVLELAQSTNDFKKDKKNPEDQLISSKAYLIFHGGLLTSCGFLSLIDAIHAFGVMQPGSLASANYIASNILFLGANIIGLEENVRLWNELGVVDGIDDNEKNLISKSAFWGILNNIGHIVATAMLLYGTATGIAIMLAALSCFAGGIKILYDLLQLVDDRAK